MATEEELDARTPEEREAAARAFMSALETIWAGLEDLSDDELATLEQELNEEIDAGIRRRAIELQRTAS